MAGAWNLVRQRGTLIGNPGRVRAGDSPDALQRLVALRGASNAKRIGVVFKRIKGGEFIYQGQRTRIETFEAAKTVFTINMMRKLLILKGDEAKAIFKVPGYSADEVIRKSLEVVADDVPDAERDNCPLVYVSKYESEAIARLLESDLLTGLQWERAASGTDGKKRPWGNNLDVTKAVYNDKGTRPVKSKPAGISAEGLHDLIGLVWELTKESVLRGGSWGIIDDYYLQAVYCIVSHPGYRADRIGFRLARNLIS
ncbi:MAG: SUMF1/EgtB/PvdO family nonheme iron enzyme [Candidatus Margulisbacteria bacterium]|nr:SUMF1/EgtB/PvdO family nonheme iron enzyme [Candidatus Margulisiibacteriota bacterium]